MEKQENKKQNLNEITELDKVIELFDSNSSCGRCLKRLGNDYKTFKKDIYRCKECSVLVDHWLKNGYGNKMFNL